MQDNFDKNLKDKTSSFYDPQSSSLTTLVMWNSVILPEKRAGNSQMYFEYNRKIGVYYYNIFPNFTFRYLCIMYTDYFDTQILELSPNIYIILINT